MGKKRSKVVVGTLILSITGILCKVLGVVFRIPLGNILGTSGMGVYQLTHSVFHIFITVSTGGVPTAVARLIAARAAKNDFTGVQYYFFVAKLCMIAFGGLCAMLLYIYAGPIAKIMGLAEAAVTLKAIAPAVFFVAVTAAYRGFYQGMQNMWPSAISQLSEQIIKIFACVFFAQLLIAKGEIYGAMGAMLGISVSEFIGMVVKIVFPGVRRNKKIAKKGSLPLLPGVKELCVTALPMTLGSAVMPTIQSIDSAVALGILSQNGYSSLQAASLFGLYSGFVMPLISLPAVFAGAISTSLVPAIAGARANDNKIHLQKQVNFGVKMSTLVGMPFAVVFFVLAEPILQILYKGLTAEELSLAVGLLRYLSPAVLCLVVAQILGGVLQGLGRIGIPVLSLLFGALIKLMIGNQLMAISSIHIYGAAIGSILFYGIVALINGMAAVKYGQVKFQLQAHIIKPLVASLFMGIAMQLTYKYLSIQLFLRFAISAAAGGIVYLLFLGLLGIIRKESVPQVFKRPQKQVNNEIY